MSKRDVISRGSSEAAYAGKLSAAAPGPPGFSTRLPIRRRRIGRDLAGDGEVDHGAVPGAGSRAGRRASRTPPRRSRATRAARARNRCGPSGGSSSSSSIPAFASPGPEEPPDEHDTASTATTTGVTTRVAQPAARHTAPLHTRRGGSARRIRCTHGASDRRPPPSRGRRRDPVRDRARHGDRDGHRRVGHRRRRRRRDPRGTRRLRPGRLGGPVRDRPGPGAPAGRGADTRAGRGPRGARGPQCGEADRRRPVGGQRRGRGVRVLRRARRTSSSARSSPSRTTGSTWCCASRSVCARSSCRGTSPCSSRPGRRRPRSPAATRSSSSPRRSRRSPPSGSARSSSTPACRRAASRSCPAPARSWATRSSRTGRVDKIGFTGETTTGAAILRASSENITRVSLELGGKSACVVFADADWERAAAETPMSVFANAGQDCCARVAHRGRARHLRRLRRRVHRARPRPSGSARRSSRRRTSDP